jgi:hypothetical protein
MAALGRVALVMVVATAMGAAFGGDAAAMVPIDGYLITGPGPVEWDPSDSGGACNSSSGFTPVADGEFDGQSDAFDDAGLIGFNGVTFSPDPDGFDFPNGIRTQSMRVNRLRFSAQILALENRPTLQYLVQVANPSRRWVKGYLTFDTNLGSDGDTVVEGSSSGDVTASKADRWLVTSDDDDPGYSDPIVTQVFHGRGADQRLRSIRIAPGGGEDCTSLRGRIAFPPEQTSYLLFFIELHEGSPAGVTTAMADAADFDARRPGSGLLTGLSPKVREHVLNWDLG